MSRGYFCCNDQVLSVHYVLIYFICAFKKRNDTYTVTYGVSDSAIPVTSFLSKTARDTCQGISTYWVYPSCETPKGKKLFSLEQNWYEEFSKL